LLHFLNIIVFDALKIFRSDMLFCNGAVFKVGEYSLSSGWCISTGMFTPGKAITLSDDKKELGTGALPAGDTFGC